MTEQQMRDAARRLRTFTAWAWLVLVEHCGARGKLRAGLRVAYLAVHHHADLCQQTDDGYSHTTAADVAQLTDQHVASVTRYLADLADRGWLDRQQLAGKRVGYRPIRDAEAWLDEGGVTA